MNDVFLKRGIKAMQDVNDPGIAELLIMAEFDLRTGRAQGIGTVFANNSRAHPSPGFRRKAHTDAPAIKRLYAIAAKYNAGFAVQMHADPDSVAEFNRLLSSDRRAKVVWAQCGTDTTADQVRPLLARHSNLHCEISWRYPPVTPPRLASRNIFDADRPNPDWLRLMEDYPDRFMIGNDAHIRSRYNEAVRVVRTRLLPYLQPETAKLIAFGNAKRLFDLP